MIALMRGGVALLSGIAAFYFMGWPTASILSLLLPDFLSALLALLAAVACAAVVAGHVWRCFWCPSVHGHDGVLGSIMTAVLVVGGIGFLVGFFGPRLVMQSGSDAPLLGFFVTGPVAGAAGAMWVRGRRRQ